LQLLDMPPPPPAAPSLRVQGPERALDAWLNFMSLLLTAALASACQGAVTSDLTLLDMG
jgi:hypothetical protein